MKNGHIDLGRTYINKIGAHVTIIKNEDELYIGDNEVTYNMGGTAIHKGKNHDLDYPKDIYSKMLHSLGVEYVHDYSLLQTNTRYRPYPTAYRNYYCGQSDLLDEAVKKEYCITNIQNNQVFYFVTQKGIDKLFDMGFKFHVGDINVS